MKENVFKRSSVFLPWLHLEAVRLQKYLRACSQGFLKACRYKRCDSRTANKCCQGVFMVFVFSLTSCSTTKTIPVETIKEVTKTDTLYINNVQYDSIYVNHDLLTDRSRDTVIIKEVNTEFRYKLLRDTIYRTKIEIQRDSIPYEVRVVETKEVRYIPPWIKTLAWIGAICILLVVLSIASKLTIH